MSSFEYVLSLFGLLLGFSLVEVLSGLVRTVKARRKVNIGILTPLLGIFVMFHVTSFWIDLWQMREHLVLTSGILYIGVALASVYYFSASLVFPERPDECIDFDAYYFEHKKQVLLGVLFCKVVVTFGKRLITTNDAATLPGVLGIAAAFMVACVVFYAATLPKGRRANIAVLLLLTLPLVITGAITLFKGGGLLA